MAHRSAALPSCASSSEHRPARQRHLLAQIRCPTLCCAPRRPDPALAVSEEMAAGIAGARLVVVDGTGHMAPLEQPEQVTRAMREWLQAPGDAGGH